MSLIFRISLVIGFIAFSPPLTVLADLVVITNPENEVTSMSADQIRRVFLARDSFLPDGSAALPVDQPENSELYREFHEKVVQMDSRELRSFWAGMIFTGRGVPPVNLAGDAEVKRFVLRNRGGIGYVAPESVDPSVKVLLRVH